MASSCSAAAPGAPASMPRHTAAFQGGLTDLAARNCRTALTTPGASFSPSIGISCVSTLSSTALVSTSA
eukprot:1151466-Alexandrium_andersonii.AAC.1